MSSIPEVILDRARQIDYDPNFLREDLAPFLYPSIDDLSLRNSLKVHFYKEWEQHLHSRDFLCFILVRLQEYLEEAYPGWQVAVPIKAYGRALHGERPPGIFSCVTPGRYFEEVSELVAQSEQGGAPQLAWTGGLNGLVDIQLKTKAWTSAKDPQLNPPWKEFAPKMVLPMADLEPAATDNFRKDISWEAESLAKNGFSGSIFRSGDIGRGRYHYIGDFFLPRDQLFPMMGKMMLILTPPEACSQQIREWAERLMNCEDPIDASEVGNEIKTEILPDQITGSSLDLRWVAEVITGGGLILRTEVGKGYSEPPKYLADIK